MSINSPHFTEPEDSLPWSQKPTLYPLWHKWPQFLSSHFLYFIPTTQNVENSCANLKDLTTSVRIINFCRLIIRRWVSWPYHCGHTSELWAGRGVGRCTQCSISGTERIYNIARLTLTNDRDCDRLECRKINFSVVLKCGLSDNRTSVGAAT